MPLSNLSSDIVSYTNKAQIPKRIENLTSIINNSRMKVRKTKFDYRHGN